MHLLAYQHWQKSDDTWLSLFILPVVDRPCDSMTLAMCTSSLFWNAAFSSLFQQFNDILMKYPADAGGHVLYGDEYGAGDYWLNSMFSFSHIKVNRGMGETLTNKGRPVYLTLIFTINWLRPGRVPLSHLWLDRGSVASQTGWHFWAYTITVPVSPRAHKPHNFICWFT